MIFLLLPWKLKYSQKMKPRALEIVFRRAITNYPNFSLIPTANLSVILFLIRFLWTADISSIPNRHRGLAWPTPWPGDVHWRRKMWISVSVAMVYHGITVCNRDYVSKLNDSIWWRRPRRVVSVWNIIEV